MERQYIAPKYCGNSLSAEMPDSQLQRGNQLF